MTDGSFKQNLLTQFARVGKAISNGNRLEILEFLAQRERSVEDLSKLSSLTVANTSQHLQLLRQSGLVTSRKEGLKVYYRLSGDDAITLLNALRTVAERHLTEVDHLVSSFLTVKDSLEPVPREELLSRVRQGLVTVIDVRPVEEFDAGHVPGAINVPLSELENKLKDFENSHEIVAYCRGPHCVLAYDAVVKLREKGLKARRMEDGYPEWKNAGLPVESSS